MKDEKEVAKIIELVNKQLDAVISDTSVPRNVRSAVQEAKGALKGEGDYVVRVSGAIYAIDSISNDINLQPQARTLIWNLLSMLESIKEDEQ
ncbi:MAG: UPF0147 family protein [Candidatus Marsarchaeota archaeon]|jgi:hypothetical protein|nr:UPF0147 family protein [Candidatus Marsarchaeota archaeon]